MVHFYIEIFKIKRKNFKKGPKSFFRLCAPFIKFDQEAINGKFSKEEIQTILVNLEEVLKIMKEYPPLEFINVKSKNTVIKIMTK